MWEQSQNEETTDLAGEGMHDSVNLLRFSWQSKGCQKFAQRVVESQPYQIETRDIDSKDLVAKLISAQESK